MDSVLMTILMLSSISVTMEQKQPLDSIPIPDVPPTPRLVQKAEDNSVLWHPTNAPPKDAAPHGAVFDGNHPDDHQITTHEHVDQSMGHVPPTKRVKKILPPFEGKLETTEGGTSPPVAETTADQTAAETTTPPKEEIEGIRLVPNESGLLLPDDSRSHREDGESSTMQKSIWDLLKERSRFTELSPTHLDAAEPAANDSRREKSLYDHFDADSAEVELEMGKLKQRSNIEKHELPISYAIPWLKEDQLDDGEPETSTARGEIPQDMSAMLQWCQRQESLGVIEDEYQGFEQRPGRWYILLLTGNSTIVARRRQDFSKYLKLNLAARLSVEYDDVRVNKVILLTNGMVVNVSLFAPSVDVAEESQLDLKVTNKAEILLYKLAETNATLLELSGEEYRVNHFFPFEYLQPEAEAQKDIPTTVSMPSRQNDLEFIAYTLLGSACACAALLIFFYALNRYYKKVSYFPWFRPRRMPWRGHRDRVRGKDHFDCIPPAVIYSGGFPQIRGPWMTAMGGLDDDSPPLMRHWGGLTIGYPTRPLDMPFTHLEGCPFASPRHSRLQIYNCDVSSVVVPMPWKDRCIQWTEETQGEGERGEIQGEGERVEMLGEGEGGEMQGEGGRGEMQEGERGEMQGEGERGETQEEGGRGQMQEGERGETELQERVLPGEEEGQDNRMFSN